MPITLLLSRELSLRLHDHLFHGDSEQVAFLLAMPREGESRELRLTDVYLAPPEEFEDRTPFYVSLVSEVRPKVIKWAWDRGACLVEAHSHRGAGPAAFSPSDLAGLDEFVPHVWWRLKGKPYVALVFTRNGFDALAWISGPQEAEPVAALRVDGERERHPSNLTYRMLSWRVKHEGRGA